ncbi:MAG: GHKL domain-containing protein [Bacteroidetes bacterium]|nr:GHKL domain-containing protein [Bacteroidota bacterium]
MLGVLFASLFATAIIVQKTYTPKNNLFQTAQTLEDRLHKKEEFVNKTLSDKAAFEKLKTLDQDEHEALNAIQDFTTGQNIWLVTFKNKQLAFWSGIKIIPGKPLSIKEGFSFLHENNGYYDAIKKTEGNFIAIFLIPVKLNYPIQNQFLKNTFAKNLLTDNNIQIADFSDNNVYEIHSIDHSYLFSVKVNPDEVSHKFFYFEVIVWVSCLLVLCLIVHSFSNQLARQGHVLIAIFTVAVFIIAIRFINLHYHWPDFRYKPQLFNPDVYHSGYIYPSFGDFCINILAITWFVTFVYRHREKLVSPLHFRVTGYMATMICAIILVVSSALLLKLFYGLVMYSKINFDVNNVLNLTRYSVLGVLMVCFAFLIFYLLIEISLTICRRLTIPIRHQVVILLAVIAAVTVASILRDGQFTFFYVLWAVWVLIRGHAYKYHNAKLRSGALVSIIVVCALVSAIKLNHFLSLKEITAREDFARKLQRADDTAANNIFKKIENKITTDFFTRKYLSDTAYSIDFLKNYLQKRYFVGHLARYDLNVYGYDSRSRPLSKKNYDLSVFRELVMYSASKVSDYFYSSINSFEQKNYFAILPVYRDDALLGTIVIELKSKTLPEENAFPELLAEGPPDKNDESKDYSYAFYVDNKLTGQNGKYVYSLTNHEFKGQLKKFIFKTTPPAEPSRFIFWTTYNHLIYQSNNRNLIVVSKEENVVIDNITSVTFFFIVFLIFSVLIIITRWFWRRIRVMYVQDNYFRWSLSFKFDKILYKTRIQLSIVFAVVVTLVLVGIITYISIVDQYDEQQENMIGSKIARVAKAFEEAKYFGLFNKITDNNQLEFDEFAKNYSADLTLFSMDGTELISTQPKIYDDKLLARRMNARAYIFLNRLQKSGFINNEIIGDLNYKAAYVPVKNEQKHITLGYMQLPYFANESDYKERVGSLLNAMINIYALIFIAIGLLAIIIARQITNPLNIIQYSLSKTIYGQKNEPIKWERDDEIGALIKEYNNMIAALEQSAQKLAQSERESAWREMAKQVAHEIKNPLTPLKLGLQLLEKSWKDKDPRFDQKFEKFSKSFVEQIESLSSIASEFSAFAKMPETRIERMDIFSVLSQVVTVFRQMDNVRISYQAPDDPFFVNADRDQLLRCFNNLLKNAIEAMPQDRSGLIEINYLVNNQRVQLSIKDNGIGIAENLREKIFEPNFTTKSSGTGLGLAFVKNSIENAGGKVWFETALGAGTTFYVSLPEAA